MDNASLAQVAERRIGSGESRTDIRTGYARVLQNLQSAAILQRISVDHLALIICCFLAAVLVGFFLVMIGPLVTLRADILMWEESDFVGNIIKLNVGAPLYTAPADSNSLIYNPGAFLSTYAIAWLLGETRSVVLLRLIQLGYVAAAVGLAYVCVLKLRAVAFPGSKIRFKTGWAVLTILALVLAATAPNTNKFVYALHVDALALLISVACFWSLLRYTETESIKSLLFMAALPSIGFLTKQFLASWIFVMLLFLVLREPTNFRRLIIFGSVASVLLVASFGVCYFVWGDNYMFWAFEVMGGNRGQIALSPDSTSMSLSRGIDHLLRAWLEIFVGLIGGWLLTRGTGGRKVVPIVVAWIALVATQAVSSGAGWGVLYHFGPSVLIGAAFIFAALPEIFDSESVRTSDGPLSFASLGRGVILITAIVAIFSAWQTVPTGARTHPRQIRSVQALPDLERYVSEIEHEFSGMNADRVLLGLGNWVYLEKDILQKDRAVSLGDQPLAGIYDNFAVTVDRLRNGSYDKILVQDFHSPYFLYDWHDWPKSSGFRSALLENYTEVRTIQPPQGNTALSSLILYGGPVSVFVPKHQLQ